MKYKYFAIDFDGTIYNSIEKRIFPHAKRVIEKIRKNGGEVGIWTCRTEKDAIEAKKILHKSSILYDSFNDTLPTVESKWGKNGRKIWADVYIDDSSIGFKERSIDWLEIERMIWGDTTV